MKNMDKLLKQARAMQDRMSRIQEELAAREVEATSGGGMVTVRMNGKQEILAVKIDPEVVDPGDVEMLEDLVGAAVNEALGKVKELAREEMSGLTGGLRIPGLF
jgi:DNA-binding YbaB/EbfC family protein